MRTKQFSIFPARRLGWLAVLCIGLSYLSARADVVEMVNGDRYVGNVISVTQTTVEFQNEIQGRTRLPRDKVAALHFRPVNAGAKTNTPAVKPTTATPTNALQQLGIQDINSNTVQQIQQQFLTTAGPDANRKFNEMVQGLAAGTLTLGDIRTQARDAAAHIREARSELGEESAELLDGYLAILESFLQKTESTPAATTPAAPQK